MPYITSKLADFWQVFVSVAASMFGVQSDSNYKRDFQKSSFVPFLVVGIIFVLGLIGILVVIVSYVVP